MKVIVFQNGIEVMNGLGAMGDNCTLRPKHLSHCLIICILESLQKVFPNARQKSLENSFVENAIEQRKTCFEDLKKLFPQLSLVIVKLE